METKYRNQWLQERERNTKFFHHIMVQNRQRAKLMRLKKDNGRYVETREDMETEIVQYFRTIMKDDRLDGYEDIKMITLHMPR